MFRSHRSVQLRQADDADRHLGVGGVIAGAEKATSRTPALHRARDDCAGVVSRIRREVGDARRRAADSHRSTKESQSEALMPTQVALGTARENGAAPGAAASENNTTETRVTN